MKLTYTDELKPSLLATLIHIAAVARSIWMDYRWQVRTLRRARRITADFAGPSPSNDTLYLVVVAVTIVGAFVCSAYTFAHAAGWL